MEASDNNVLVGQPVDSPSQSPVPLENGLPDEHVDGHKLISVATESPGGTANTAGTRYRTIVADPPWPYGPGSVRGTRQAKRDGTLSLGVSSEELYGSMTIEELCGLDIPADDNAHLYLWTTNAFMDEAHDIARAWDFVPKTILTYGKVQPDGRPSMKTGYYFRGASEHALFCVRGSLALVTDASLPTLWLWPRLPHSVKPDAFYDLVEKASPGPYLEMFSRRARFGWDVWGNESLGTAELGA